MDMTDDVPEERQRRVTELCKMVRADLDHWKYAFTRMNKWRDFARGLQWPGTKKEDLSNADRSYTANITMRHLKQRTASIYAKNPTFIWRQKQRLVSSIWDGNPQSLMIAQQAVATGADIDGSQMMVLQDAMQAIQQRQQSRKWGETLTFLYGHFWREQIPTAKKMAKKQVLTALTCGVAYFKQTFQRAMDYPPDVSRSIQDHLAMLKHVERLALEAQDGDIGPGDAKLEELRTSLAALEQTEQIILREGLAFDYPDSTNIIPDRNMTYLPGFVGCGHMTEQYCLTPEQVREVYGVDIGKRGLRYTDNDLEPVGISRNTTQRETVRVWEIWSRDDNMVYHVCEGYPDYLREPHPPEAWTERFYPWFVYAPNAIDDPTDPFPPSDVELMMSQQMEINRAGEALREHRFAARPGWVTGSNIPDEDRVALGSRVAHSITVLRGLGEDGDIKKMFQAFPTPGIDPNLYNTGPAFDDILRSVGTQEANLGGSSGSTATETSIAEGSRQSALASAIDEFDDLLSEMARAGGQILMKEMSPEKVMQIVGRGAFWPPQTQEQLADEIYLEAVAGSSGRPNQAQEVSLLERVFPLLFQLPGISHEEMARFAIRAVSDTANLDDWISTGSLPVMSLSSGMAGPGGAPEQQGAAGHNNAPRPPGPQSGQGGPQPGEQGFGLSPMQ